MKAAEFVKELRETSVEDLRAKLIELRKEQMTLRMQLATGQITKNDGVKKLRRDVARVKTILGEKAKALAGNQGDAA